MKIGVLSDTHLGEPTAELERVLTTYFDGVDTIFHAGDFVARAIVDYLSRQRELIAVHGNMDPPDIRMVLPEKRIVELGTFRIALIHGGGSPFGIESRIREEFDAVDAIVYGHTHTPANHQIKGTLFFNPGSLTRSFIHRPTLGILHLGERLEGEIIKI